MNYVELSMSYDFIAVIALVVVPAIIVLFFAVFVAKQYKRCPSNKVLVIYGKIAGDRSARCVHGGGFLVIPLIQDYAYLSLEPMTIEIDLKQALSKHNIRVNAPSTFTIGVSIKPEIMNNAAERLLGLTFHDISIQAQNIILGQMRLIIATLSIEEINQDREKFLDLVEKNVNLELNKVGLEVINVNIRDITDESGYIEAIGKKAAAEAINTAKVEVAQQEKDGAIGEETARREKEVKVSEQQAKTVQGQKAAEQERRVIVAQLEAEAIKGENLSKATMAEYDAELKERQAEARRRGEMALASAARDVYISEKEQEVARLEKSELAQKEVDKKKIEIDAEAEAERIRRIGKGEADAVAFKYAAEAEGIRKILDAKAEGYKNFLATMGSEKGLAPTLLLIEQMPELVAQQVKAIQDLKIDSITVWENGGGQGSGSSTANFLKSLIGSLPPIHELAKQAGIDLPEFLGKVLATETVQAESKNDSSVS